MIDFRSEIKKNIFNICLNFVSLLHVSATRSVFSFFRLFETRREVERTEPLNSNAYSVQFQFGQ